MQPLVRTILHWMVIVYGSSVRSCSVGFDSVETELGRFMYRYDFGCRKNGSNPERILMVALRTGPNGT